MVRTRHLAKSLSIFLIQHTARPTRRWRIWSAEESWGCRMLWNVMTADEPEPEPSFHSVYPSANSTLIRGSWFPSDHDPEAPRTTTPTDGSAFFCSLSLSKVRVLLVSTSVAERTRTGRRTRPMCPTSSSRIPQRHYTGEQGQRFGWVDSSDQPVFNVQRPSSALSLSLPSGAYDWHPPSEGSSLQSESAVPLSLTAGESRQR